MVPSHKPRNNNEKKVYSCCRLKIRVKTNSSTTRISFIPADEDYLEICLFARPHNFQANSQLVSYLSKILKQEQASITLCKHTLKSKMKLIEIQNLKFPHKSADDWRNEILELISNEFYKNDNK